MYHLNPPSSQHSQSPAAHGDDDFDQSLGGRRISAYYDSDGALFVLTFQVLTLLSGRLGIKNVSESPEIRNISERGDRGSSEDPEELGSEAECIEGESERTKRALPANCSRPPVSKSCLDIRDSGEVCSLGAAASYRSAVYYEWRCCVEVGSVAAVSACCGSKWGCAGRDQMETGGRVFTSGVLPAGIACGQAGTAEVTFPTHHLQPADP